MNDWGQAITIIVSIVVGVGGIVIYVNRQTNKRIDDFRNDVNRRFEAVDRQFEAVDRRFDAVDKRFDAVDRRFDEIRADIRLILNKLIPERKSKDSD
ncbi:hypothetical protein J4G02_21020 [Candidatus Poribacteria bacterium]|nr:hypothetical protein [Candidatus Poribacteria bacterium]